MAAYPSLAAVAEIAALPDPVLRNLRITHSYHDLAAALGARTGPRANWCSFAAWASKQAGVTIRQGDLAREFQRLSAAAPALGLALEALLGAARVMGADVELAAVRQAVAHAWDPLAAFARSSAAVARGNLKVFDEIGRAFARFYALCLDDPAFDAAHLEAFCAELRPGDPPAGQQYLRQAFTRYYQALFEPNAQARAELLLLANLEIGYHEQVRLQPEILEALDAPAPEAAPLKRRLAALIFRQGSWAALAAWVWQWLLRRPTPLDRAVDQVTAALQRQARLIATDYLMTLELPGARLRLGDDLPAAFPAALQQLANADLLVLLARLDLTPDSPRGTGARDWADLPQRLHFILDLFRCYAEDPALFNPPFSAAQLAELQAGRVPAGPL